VCAFLACLSSVARLQRPFLSLLEHKCDRHNTQQGAFLLLPPALALSLT
jgi:hypothetical protein